MNHFLEEVQVFFSLRPQKAYLSDLNTELIDTYKVVRDNVEELINQLGNFKNNEDYYYLVRDKKVARTKIEEAARFIYLNQTSFNGLYRVNLQGKYNVPYGY